MIRIELGKLLAIAAQTSADPSLLRRFLAAKKPVAKYFCNRHLSKLTTDDALAGFAARDAIHESYGAKVDATHGVWVVPADKQEACAAEVAALHAKVLEYPECIPAQARDLVDFAATESEMEALADFVTA